VEPASGEIAFFRADVVRPACPVPRDFTTTSIDTIDKETDHGIS
jgi:hypothetical protein